MTQVAIVGYGFVGRAMHKLFPYALIHDLGPIYESRQLVNERADVAFICVPTPGSGHGELDTSIVEAVIAWCECPLIVIRSTVNPGTADYLEQKYGRNIVVMPEYIGETTDHPLLDEKARRFLVIGGRPENRRKVIELFQSVYNSAITLRQVTNYVAECIKLAENRAIAWKVMQIHELYRACEAAGVDFYTVRDAVYGDDPRFNLWFAWPYPDKPGFESSKCLRKDVPAWCAWAESAG